MSLETLPEEVVNQDEPGTVADIEEPADTGAGETEVAEEEAEQVIVSLSDEPPPVPAEEEKAPEWVRQLRKSSREKDRRIKELESKLNSTQPENKPELKLGARPKLDDDGIDFDEDVYAERLAEWLARKRDIEAKEAQVKAEAEKADKAWQSQLDGYAAEKEKARTKMGLEDFEEAESEAMESLSVTQRALAIKALKQPALFIYALGKDKKALEECAKISDPVEFVAHVSRLEATKLKTTKRSELTPAPERKLTGSGPVSGSVDSTLERLREEANRTGDYTKVIQYKKQKATK